MTQTERHRLLETLFHQWVDLDDATRLTRLNQLAHEEPSLHQELAALFGQSSQIAAGERALDHFAHAAQQLAGTPSHPDVIGPYSVLRKIGEGGMGQVFEAEQSAPVKRRVAIKLLRTGLSDERALQRFMAERQTLTLLDHPNIARILDAGTHTDGRPWFAMELVDGVSIAAWVESHNLGFRERIELLLPVCEAVQHAHLKGIIHRDLKPSNILVSTAQDGTAHPRIIDFGIAKAIRQLPADDARVSTRSGELLGTPEYMSPEQASMGALDVDTRTDVYALGLVLFELLVGELPLSVAQLRSFAFDEMCRRIREEEPAKPSELVQTQRKDRGSLSSADWARRLRGDLDAVVLKALAKDRDQRYISVSEFAADLRRYLADKPVLATPPNWRYRLRKWAKRNRALAAAAGIAVAALLLGSVLAAHGYLRAQQAAEEARLAQAQAESTTQFMLGLFKAANPGNEPGRDPSARELLARGVSQLQDPNNATLLAPSVRMLALENLAEASWALGDYETAETLLIEALQARQQEQPTQAKRLAYVLDQLGDIARDRKSDYPLAIERHRAAYDVLLQAGLASSVQGMRALNNTAIALRRSGKLAESEEAYRSVIVLERSLSTKPTERLAAALLNLSIVQSDLGERKLATANMAEARRLFEQLLPKDHPNFSTLYSNMGLMQRKAGDLHSALELIQKARANEDINFPKTQPGRTDSMHNEASVRLRLGQLNEADALLIQTQALLQQTLGENSARSFIHTGTQAEILLERGRYGEAVSLLQGLLALMPDNPSTLKQRLISTRRLALAQRGLRDFAAASQSAAQYRALAQAAKNPQEEAVSELLLAMIQLDLGQGDIAATHYTQALSLDPRCAAEACVLDQATLQLTRAQYLARTGQLDAAVSALGVALNHRDWSASTLSHPDLQSLHGLPGWAPLQASLSLRMQQKPNSLNAP